MRGSFALQNELGYKKKTKIAEEHSLVYSRLCYDNSIYIFFKSS